MLNLPWSEYPSQARLDSASSDRIPRMTVGTRRGGLVPKKRLRVSLSCEGKAKGSTGCLVRDNS